MLIRDFFLYIQIVLLCILKVVIQYKPIKVECFSMQKKGIIGIKEM